MLMKKRVSESYLDNLCAMCVGFAIWEEINSGSFKRIKKSCAESSDNPSNYMVSKGMQKAKRRVVAINDVV